MFYNYKDSSNNVFCNWIGSIKHKLYKFILVCKFYNWYIRNKQYISDYQNSKKTKLKGITKTFLIAQGLDIVTTFIGLNLGTEIYESNPMVNKMGWFVTIPIKFIVILLVCIVFQMLGDKNKLYWWVVIPVIITVILNVLVMFLTIF